MSCNSYILYFCLRQDCSTDFEFLPIDVSLGRCFRYFYASTNIMWLFGNYANFGGAGGVSLNNIRYPVRMRASPSYTHGTTAGNSVADRLGSTPATFTISSSENSGADSLNMSIYNGGGGLSWSATDSFTVGVHNFTANAEL